MSENSEEQSVQNNTPKDSVEGLLQEVRAELNNLRAAKADIDFIKDSKNEIDQLKSEVNQAKGAIDADLSSISEAKENFSSLRQQTSSQSTQAQNKISALDSDIENLDKTKEELRSILTELQKIKNEADENKSSVDTAVQNINENKDEFERLRSEAQSVHSDLNARQTDAQNKIAEIENIHSKIDELFTELLEDEKDDEEKIIRESKKRQILELHTEITNLLKAISNDREQSLTDTQSLKKQLEEEIRSLLPKAGAAGLSSAYVQAKSRYGSIPFDKKVEKKWDAFKNWSWHQLVSRTPTFIYYTMFIVPLGLMTWLFYDLFTDLSEPVAQGTLKPDVDEFLLFLRISLAIPLGVISLFGWSSIRLNRRLFEEYNHKQRVMQLYHSFKKEIDEIDSEDHKKALLAVMIKTVDDKPSLTMHKYDKGFEGLLPGFSLGSLISLNKKSED